MIVNEYDTYFEMITQHEHARISYEFFKYWGDDAVTRSSLWEALLIAVREHDRSWITLDRHPEINPDTNKPCDFTNYPEKEKLKAYQTGIKTVAEKHPYSGLLNSLHYTSFFTDSTNTEEEAAFLHAEQARQKQLRDALNPEDEEFHLRLLQFCDDVSLYACLNEPGATKAEELSWFKHGFQHTFSFLQHETVQARFTSAQDIQLTPFPLQSPLHVAIEGTIVYKQDIQAEGIKAAYENGEHTVRKLRFIP
ncbi:Protein of unknown function [Alteribacillus persepolensis]|uniref:DUF3891 domain-containing protein n=1 Tax=Alteribacillus persepolensis TaxID=568899 RepID=A0A1G7ZB76_9BACI|nr:DUF3891 family protein [Alteribacillus persepolensis]SDH06003.1 Protein of unknown function [Alteribacillus persepolensis]